MDEKERLPTMRKPGKCVSYTIFRAGDYSGLHLFKSHQFTTNPGDFFIRPNDASSKVQDLGCCISFHVEIDVRASVLKDLVLTAKDGPQP